MEQKNQSMQQKKSTLPVRVSRGFSKEEIEEYKAIMKQESSGGISVYDYYYLDQDEI